MCIRDRHCRKVADSIAYLQVKKILWTEDGWPVISPLVYAGEKEQKIPKEMIYGTWDLSSVGQTIMTVSYTHLYIIGKAMHGIIAGLYMYIYFRFNPITTAVFEPSMSRSFAISSTRCV